MTVDTPTEVTLNESSRILARTWRALSGEQRRALGIGLLAMVGASALAALFPVLAGSLIDNAIGPNNKVSLSKSLPALGLIVLVVFVQQALTVVRRTFVENAATAYERDQRDEAYCKNVRTPVSEDHEDRVGEMIGGGNRAIEGAVKVLKLAGLDLVPALMLAVFAIVVSYTKNPVIATVMLGVLPTGLALVWLQIKNQKGVRVDIRDAKSNIDGRMTEILFSIVSIRTAGAETFFTKRVRTVCEHLRDREYDHHKAMARWDAAKALNEGFWLSAVLAAAIALAASGRLTIGEITSYLLLFTSVLVPIRELHRILDEWSESTTQAEQHFALLDSQDDVRYDTRPAGPAPTRALGLVPPAVMCSGVRFTHAGKSEPVLDGLDLQVSAGEHLGMVGASGCGKSTLLQLLTRIVHGYEGGIELFGTPLRELAHESLTATVGFVPQAPEMFRGTIAENIALWDPRIAQADIEEAAKLSHIHDFIVNELGGYDASVSERAKNLSGGQQQRICLARALVRKPRLLLLDEPTAALDAASERRVTEAIDGLRDVTEISVAHRLQTLRTCDRIVVMDDGRIAQVGSFSQLSVAEGIFADLLRADGQHQLVG